MVGHNKRESTNSSSKYPTIGRLMTFNVVPLCRVARNLNPDFSTVRSHIIIESMQHLAPKGRPWHARFSKGLN
jgi:hypothetical protein